LESFTVTGIDKSRIRFADGASVGTELRIGGGYSIATQRSGVLTDIGDSKTHHRWGRGNVNAGEDVEKENDF